MPSTSADQAHAYQKGVHDPRFDGDLPALTAPCMKGLPVGRTPIQFEGDYIAVSQEEYKRWARDPRFDYAHRVEYAAMGWANQIGHAEFLKGKLNEVLADKNGKSLSVNALNNHIRKAKGWGFVEPESNRRCLVLPECRVQKGIGDKFCESTACIRRGAGARRADSFDVQVVRARCTQYVSIGGAAARETCSGTLLTW